MTTLDIIPPKKCYAGKGKPTFARCRYLLAHQLTQYIFTCFTCQLGLCYDGSLFWLRLNSATGAKDAAIRLLIFFALISECVVFVLRNATHHFGESAWSLIESNVRLSDYSRKPGCFRLDGIRLGRFLGFAVLDSSASPTWVCQHPPRAAMLFHIRCTGGNLLEKVTDDPHQFVCFRVGFFLSKDEPSFKTPSLLHYSNCAKPVGATLMNIKGHKETLEWRFSLMESEIIWTSHAAVNYDNCCFRIRQADRRRHRQLNSSVTELITDMTNNKNETDHIGDASTIVVLSKTENHL